MVFTTLVEGRQKQRSGATHLVGITCGAPAKSGYRTVFTQGGCLPHFLGLESGLTKFTPTNRARWRCFESHRKLTSATAIGC